MSDPLITPMSEWPAHIEYWPHNGQSPWVLVRVGPNGERPIMAYRTHSELVEKSLALGFANERPRLKA